MAFDPATFYTLADELRLKSQVDGPHLRAMISRAYYSALICARDELDTPPTDPGQGSHEAIIKAYRGIDAQNDRIADYLNDLRILRVKADYKPKAEIKAGEGLQALSKARNVLQTLQRFPQQPSAAALTTTSSSTTDQTGH